jgi:hippurate hydrolase
MTTLRADAARLAPEIVALRRAVHADPEVSLHLPATQRRVLAALDGLPLEVSTGRGLSSVVAVLRGGRPGPTVLLRADMDALPVTEATGLPYAASNGAMHACGHDLHVAGLVGAARLLSARRGEIAGDVVFMFQPGEEGYDGAGLMIDEGVLSASGTTPTAAYGVHVTTDAPAGTFRGRPGALMAASATVDVTLHGAGGHGSRPYETRDPVPALAELVGAIQTAVARRFDPDDPVVISVGRLRAGEAGNVIPDRAELSGTVRAFSAAVVEQARAEITRLATHVAAAHDLTAEVRVIDQYPPTITDPAHTAAAAATVREVFGADRWSEMQRPKTAAEDFSRILSRVPGTFVFLGARPADGPTAPNHSPLAVFDDQVIADGSVLLAALALRHVGTLAPADPEVT